MELEEYKQLLKISDITKDKDTKFQTVINDFRATEAYLEEEAQNIKSSDELWKQHWERVMESVGTNIGPTGSVRRKVKFILIFNLKMTSFLYFPKLIWYYYIFIIWIFTIWELLLA